MRKFNGCVLRALTGKSGDNLDVNVKVIIGYHDVTVATGFNVELALTTAPIVSLTPS